MNRTPFLQFTHVTEKKEECRELRDGIIENRPTPDEAWNSSAEICSNVHKRPLGLTLLFCLGKWFSLLFTILTSHGCSQDAQDRCRYKHTSRSPSKTGEQRKTNERSLYGIVKTRWTKEDHVIQEGVPAPRYARTSGETLGNPKL